MITNIYKNYTASNGMTHKGKQGKRGNKEFSERGREREEKIEREMGKKEIKELTKMNTMAEKVYHVSNRVREVNK